MLGEVVHLSIVLSFSLLPIPSDVTNFIFFCFFSSSVSLFAKPSKHICFPISFFLHKMSYTVSVFHLAVYSRNHSLSVNESLSHSILQQHIFTPLYVYNRGYPGGSDDKAAAAAKSLQLCLTLCDPIDGSPPGSPVPGILQARALEWVAMSFSNA